MAARRVDLTGERFGRLIVVEQASDAVQPSGQRKRRWLTRCDCGVEVVVRADNLKSGNTNSCGCFQDEVRSLLSISSLT
jgi:hypothetical protein